MAFFSPWQRNGKLGGETNIPYPSLHYRHIPGHFYFLYGIVYLILIGKQKTTSIVRLNHGSAKETLSPFLHHFIPRFVYDKFPCLRYYL